jgi:hypothetical protein
MSGMYKKACGTRNSKNNPAYTKPELIELAVDKGLRKVEANKMKVDELCNYLGLNNVVNLNVQAKEINIKDNLNYFTGVILLFN